MDKKTEEKRIFLALLGTSLLFLTALALLVLYVATHAGNMVVFYIQIAVIVFLVGIVIIAGLGIAIMVYIILSRRPVGRAGQFLIKVALFFYPAAMWIGRLFRININKTRASFIALNNNLVRSNRTPISPDRILVLLPHCLQKFECERKITNDIANCVGCGRCDIRDIKELCGDLGVHVVVATGGTLARKAAKELRPKAIVAVACERDLFSGLLDVQPLPALGVLNLRPEGPCFNTRVNLDQLEAAIRFFTEGAVPAQV